MAAAVAGGKVAGAAAGGKRKGGKRGGGGSGSAEGAAAVPSSRVQVTDLAAWRQAQTLYPVFVGPEPKA